MTYTNHSTEDDPDQYNVNIGDDSSEEANKELFQKKAAKRPTTASKPNKSKSSKPKSSKKRKALATKKSGRAKKKPKKEKLDAEESADVDKAFQDLIL